MSRYGHVRRKKTQMLELDEVNPKRTIATQTYWLMEEGGEKLYVTKDKRRSNSWRRCLSWIVACTVLSVILIVAILAGTGVILSQEPNMVKEASVGRNFGGTDLKPFVTTGTLDVASGHTTNEPGILPETNMTYTYVPRSIESQLILDNEKWSPALLDSNSTEYQQLTSVLEDQLKMILFSKETLEFGESNIGLNVVNISNEPLTVLYRIGWNFKSDVQNPAEPIAMEDVKKRLVESLNRNQGYIDKYHIDVQGIKVGRVIDICQINNGECSHICYYNYQNQQFACTCPTNLVLDRNLKACIEWSESAEEDYASVPNRNGYTEGLDESVDFEHSNFDDHDPHIHYELNSSTTNQNDFGSTSQSNEHDNLDDDGHQNHDHNYENGNHQYDRHEGDHQHNHNYHHGDEHSTKSFSTSTPDLSSVPTKAPNPEVPFESTPEPDLESAAKPDFGSAHESEPKSVSQFPESATESSPKFVSPLRTEPVTEPTSGSAVESINEFAFESKSPTTHGSVLSSTSINEYSQESGIQSASEFTPTSTQKLNHESGTELAPTFSHESVSGQDSESIAEATHGSAQESDTESATELSSERGSGFVHESTSESVLESNSESGAGHASKSDQESETESVPKQSPKSAVEYASKTSTEFVTEPIPITNFSSEREEIDQHKPSDFADLRHNDIPEIVTNSIKSSEKTSPTSLYAQESASNVTSDLNLQTKYDEHDHHGNISSTADPKAVPHSESSAKSSSEHNSEILPHNSSHLQSTPEPGFESTTLPSNLSPEHSHMDSSETMEDHTHANQYFNKDSATYQTEHSIFPEAAQPEVGIIDSEKHHTPLSEAIDKDSSLNATEELDENSQVKNGSLGTSEVNKTSKDVSEEIIDNSSPKSTELPESISEHTVMPETSDTHKISINDLNQSTESKSEKEETLNENVPLREASKSSTINSSDMGNNYEVGVTTTNHPVIGDLEETKPVNNISMKVKDGNNESITVIPRVDNVDLQMTNNTEFENNSNTYSTTQSSWGAEHNVQNTTHLEGRLSEELWGSTQSIVSETTEQTGIHSHHFTTPVHVVSEFSVDEPKPKIITREEEPDVEEPNESNTSSEFLTSTPVLVSTNSSEETSTIENSEKLDKEMQVKHHENHELELSKDPNFDVINHDKSETITESEMTTMNGDNKSLFEVTEKVFPSVETNKTSNTSQEFSFDGAGTNQQKEQESSPKHLEEFSNNIKDEGLDNEGFNTLLDNDYKNKHDYSINEKEIHNKYSNKQSFLKSDKKKLKDSGKLDKIENEKKAGDDSSTNPSVTPEDFILQKHVNGDDFESNFGFEAEHTTKSLGNTPKLEMPGDGIPGFGYTDSHDISLLQTVSPALKTETIHPDNEKLETPGSEIKTGMTENKEEENKTEKEYSKFEKDYKYDKQKGARKKDLKKKLGTKDGKNVELDDTKKYYMEVTGKYNGTEKDVSSSVIEDNLRGFAEATTDSVMENLTVSPTLSDSETNNTSSHGDEDLTTFSQIENVKTASEPDLVHLQEIDNHDKIHETIAETTLQPYKSNFPAKTESPEKPTTILSGLEHLKSSEIRGTNKDRDYEMGVTELPIHRNEEVRQETDTNTGNVTEISGRTEEKVIEMNSTTENEKEKNRTAIFDINEAITHFPESHQLPENENMNGRVDHAEIIASEVPVAIHDTNLFLNNNEGVLVSSLWRENNSDITLGKAFNGQMAVNATENNKSQLLMANASISEPHEDSTIPSLETIVYKNPSSVAEGQSEVSEGGVQFRIDEHVVDGAKYNQSAPRSLGSLPVFFYANNTTGPLNLSLANSSARQGELWFNGQNDSFQDFQPTKNFTTSLYTFGTAPVSEIFNASTIPDGRPFIVQNYTFTTENISSSNPSIVIEEQNGTLQNDRSAIFRTAAETFVKTLGDSSTTEFGNVTVYKIENGTLPDTVYDGHFNPQEGHYHMFSNSSGTFTYSSTPPNFVIRGESGDFGRSTIYILGNRSRTNNNSSGSPRSPQVIFRNATIFAIRNLTDNDLSTQEQQEATLTPNNLESLTHNITTSSFASDTSYQVNDNFGFISKCAAGQFQCISGTSKRGSACINLSSKCDSINDCSDGSDEAGCIENGCLGNFQCVDGTCLKRHLVCNGMVDCSDGSDEKQCETWKCGFDEFQCPSGRCIPVVWQCDSKADCDNHTDERNCQRSCGNDEYLCPEGWCIPLTYKCNGVKECSHGEDELLCDCSIDEFKCQSGGCVPKNQVCNGLDDCPDRSDEWNCVKLEPNSGLLQIRTFSNEYLPVCADNWSAARSDEVCASLGYSSSSPVDTGSTTSITNEKSFYVLKNETTADNKSNYLVNLVRTNETCSSQKLIEISCQEFSCGSRSMTDGSSAEARLVGGMSATAGQWPSVVLLYNFRNLHSCTASVLTPRWVLASYNCLKMGNRNLNQQDWKLFGGSTVFETEKENGEIRKIVAIIPHPQVKFNQFLFSNDLALVKLDEPLPFSSSIGAVCLPEQEIQPRQICVTAGWGMDTPQDKNIRQQLQYLPVPTMNLTDCNSTEHYSGFITNDKICAGYNAAEKSLCYNEEGAPLMCVNERGEWEIQGVLSYHSNCGRGSHPSIFSNIAPVLDWIKETIGNSFERKITPAAKR